MTGTRYADADGEDGVVVHGGKFVFHDKGNLQVRQEMVAALRRARWNQICTRISYRALLS